MAHRAQHLGPLSMNMRSYERSANDYQRAGTVVVARVAQQPTQPQLAQTTGATFKCQSVSCWNTSPTRSTVASSNGLPTICSERGRPSLVNPIGIHNAGRPITFQIDVNDGTFA